MLPTASSCSLQLFCFTSYVFLICLTWVQGLKLGCCRIVCFFSRFNDCLFYLERKAATKKQPQSKTRPTETVLILHSQSTMPSSGLEDFLLKSVTNSSDFITFRFRLLSSHDPTEASGWVTVGRRDQTHLTTRWLMFL